MRKEYFHKIKSHHIWATWILILIIINNYINIFIENTDWGELLWFCDTTSILLAFGLFFKDVRVISLVLTTSIPAQFLWIADFFLQLLFKDGLGRTAWLFADNDLWITPWISTIMHAILIPISFYYTYKWGYYKKVLYWVYMYIFVILIPAYYITNPFYNRNCVFYPCDISISKDSLMTIQNYISSNTYFISGILEWFIYGTLSYFALYILFIHILKKENKLT